MSNNNNTPRALREYRALAASDRQAYDPSGKRGADDVRRLQHIARAVAALREVAPAPHKGRLRLYDTPDATISPLMVN